MKNNIVFLFTLWLCLSCNSRNNEMQNNSSVTEIPINDFPDSTCNSSNNHELQSNSSVIEISINDFPGSKGILYSEIFDSIGFVKLETKSESLIGRIDKIIYYKNKYFILDQIQSKSVFVFNDYGKFLGKIGKNGNGPGEYDEPNDIAIDPFSDKVLVYVNNYKCILSYDLDGKFHEKIKLDYWIKSLSVLEENVLALYFDYTENTNISKESGHNLLLINKKSGKIINKAFAFEKNMNFGIGGFSFFDRSTDALLVSPGYSNTIFTINTKSVTPKYHINFGKYEIPKELFSIKSQGDFNKELKNSNYAFLNGYFDTPNYLLFSFVSSGKIYDCAYSKKTGKLKYSDIFVNDMYGFIVGGKNSAHNNDKVISYTDPSSIEEIKKIYNSSLTDGVILKKELLNYYNKFTEGLNEKMKIDFRRATKLIETAEFYPTIKEIQFVNSINSGDNPILIVAKMKAF